MFTRRFTYIPAQGKMPELQALLTERVTSLKQQGVQANLVTQLFNPDGPALVLTARFADIEAGIGEVRKRNAANPAFQAYNQQLNQLMSCPNRDELFEIITAPGTVTAVQGWYLERSTWTPAFGTGPEHQKILEEQAKARQAQGRGGNLTAQLFNPAGPSFALVVTAPDLGAYEEFRKARTPDAQFQAFISKARALMAGPQKVELFEVLIPN